MRLLFAIPALLAAVALGGWLSTGEAARLSPTGSEAAVDVRLGDQIRIAGAPIACRVVRMSQLGGRVVVDCRRAGALAGTYGTLFTAHEAALVRFTSKRKAKLLVVGTHDGTLRRCE